MVSFRSVASGGLGAMATVVLIAACEQGGELKAGFGPEPDGRVPQSLIVISPVDSTLVGTTVQLTVVGYNTAGDSVALSIDWSAHGGSITPTGRFSASTSGRYWVRATDRPTRRGLPERVPPLSDSVRIVVLPGTPRVTGLTILPDTVSLTPGGTQPFTAETDWSDGTTRPSVATWSATGGSVSNSGVFSAGSTPGDFVVIATDTSGLADTAAVTIAPATLVQVILSPATVALNPGSTQQFQATSVFSDGSSAGSGGIAFTATGGTITSNGLYTAGSTAGQFRVIVLHAASGLADTSSVGIGVPPPTLTGISVAPASVTLDVAEQTTFSTTGTLSDGSNTTVTVTYSATGGSITTAGRYTAGSTPGSYSVIATHQSGLADTADVVIQSATLVSMNLTPDVVSLDPGALQQFAVSGQLSNGQSTVPTVSYQVTGGSINGSGIYTAGATPGGYRVIATAVNGMADTSSVTINAPVVVAVTVAPASISLNFGGTQNFSATGTLNTGGSTSVTVVWSATGGSISSGGGYTAGSTAGSFQVIATEQSQGVADTAVVQIQAPATLQSIVVSPSSASVQTGTTSQFSASGIMSDGSTTTPAVTWSATGGGVSSGGLYTAGAATGSYQVVAAHASGLADTAAVTVTAAPPPPPPPTGNLPELPRVFVNSAYVPPTGNTITVNAGDNLQAAINAAQPGDEIVLQAGATFTGAFTLPVKGGTDWITIRSSDMGSLPPEGQRVRPSHASAMPTILPPSGNAPAFTTLPGASYYRLMGLEVTAPSSMSSLTRLVNLGDGDGSIQNTLSQVPDRIILDRMYIHGHTTLQMQRCVELHTSYSAIVDSWISDCHINGFDSQAILGYNGPGPYKIVNNFLEAAAENVMFGGADPSILNNIPSDIEIRNNHFYKPLTWWVNHPSYAGQRWTVKNLFELKMGRRVLVEGNVFENVWADAQNGFAILIKSTNQGTAAWSQTTDVTFRYNIVRHAASAVNIANISNVTTRVLIAHNLFEDIGGPWGNDRQFQALDGEDVRFEHNTVIYAAGATPNSLAWVEGPNIRFTFNNNLGALGSYGVAGSGVAPGTATLQAYAPNYEFSGNVLVGTPTHPYPAGTQFPSSWGQVGLVDFAGGNYRLTSSSPYSQGGNGNDPGADINQLENLTAGVVISP